MIMTTIKIDKNNYEQEVQSANEPVLLDFWAPWCGPCRMVGPILEEVAQAVDGKAKVGKVNVDEEPELARTFGVMSIPTLVVIKDGRVAQTTVGVQSKEALIKMLGV